MSTYIHNIATETAPFIYSQDFIREKMQSWTPDEKRKRLLHAIYRKSGIETRYSVLEDFLHEAGGSLFQIDANGVPSDPRTAERNAIYATTSRHMAVSVAKKVLENSGFTTGDVTHVVFASCTGFCNPGPDFHIIRELGLNPNVERYTVGFMGCYAAFPALRMASQFCQASARAVVLVVCLELCTLHMHLDQEADTMLANSLFADGAGAAILSAREPSPGRPAYRVGSFASALVPQSESHMAWNIGNHGFNIVLSSYVPDILAAGLRPMLEDLLRERHLSLGDIQEWAVHPGGRAILDKVESSLDLPGDSLATSRRVLRDFGNMSSATVLFVLKDLLDSAETPDAVTCAMAFGPGLTVETAFLHRMACRDPKSMIAASCLPLAQLEPAFQN